MFDPSDLLIELCIKIAYRSVSLFVTITKTIARGIWGAVNVRQKAPEENHTAVEYVDALLFPE